MDQKLSPGAVFTYRDQVLRAESLSKFHTSWSSLPILGMSMGTAMGSVSTGGTVRLILVHFPHTCCRRWLLLRTSTLVCYAYYWKRLFLFFFLSSKGGFFSSHVQETHLSVGGCC